MLWIIVLLGMVGSGKMDGNSTTPGPLRKTLHGPTAGSAPSTVVQALTISESAGASHFQKLSGKNCQYRKENHYEFYVVLRCFPISLSCSGCVGTGRICTHRIPVSAEDVSEGVKGGMPETEKCEDTFAEGGDNGTSGGNRAMEISLRYFEKGGDGPDKGNG